MVPEDRKILEFLVRAILDSCWAQDPSTAEATMNGGRRCEETIDKFWLPSATPLMGPFPLEDNFGMQIAIAVMDCSLDPDSYETTVQYDIFSKIFSSATNTT